MRSIYRISIILILLGGLSLAGTSDKKNSRFENFNVDIENGSLILSSKYDHGEYVEITNEFELIVNGETVALGSEQQEMIRTYREHFFSLIKNAKELGFEGAWVGIHGAKIGAKAVVGAIKMLFSDYDEDDLEEDLEREAEKLEERAEELEKKAELLEDRAEQLERLHDDLRHEIRALRQLNWF